MSDSFGDFVLDQLRDIPGLDARAMFGGFGLYDGPVFFGIIHAGRLYFATDEQSRSAYTDLGMEPFRPNERQTLKSYYEVPPEVVEDGSELTEWARTAAASKAVSPTS